MIVLEVRSLKQISLGQNQGVGRDVFLLGALEKNALAFLVSK